MLSETASPALSYAAYFEHPFKRRLVRAVERVSGQPRIQKLYDRYRAELAGKEPFFSAAVKLLDLNVQFSASRLASIPRTGPLVVVANHPFGVLDGLVICWLVSLVRSDFRILTNAVLDGAPEARDWLLPVDFAGTRTATAVNLATRKRAMELLKTGGCVIVFPAGGISTVPAPFMRTALDDDWKPFTAKLISASHANVVPVFFEGQNSHMFQLASHLGLELRLALIFREVRRRMGTVMPVHIGEVLDPDTLGAAGRRALLMKFLRESTYDLAPPDWQDRFRKAERKAADRAARRAGSAFEPAV